MQPLPHRYSVQLTGRVAGDLRVSGSSLPDLAVAAPVGTNSLRGETDLEVRVATAAGTP